MVGREAECKVVQQLCPVAWVVHERAITSCLCNEWSAWELWCRGNGCRRRRHLRCTLGGACVLEACPAKVLCRNPNPSLCRMVMRWWRQMALGSFLLLGRRGPELLRGWG